MAYSKVIFNGSTLMDVTQDTVTSGKLLSGEKATGADGQSVTGNIVSKTASDITVSDGTVTVPAGFYATEAEIEVPGGGGSSNSITGTFTGTTTGMAMDVTIPYNGNGYPIMIAIAPKGGIIGNSTFYSLVKRYATASFFIYKSNADASPSYTSTGDANDATNMIYYKSSSSNYSAYGSGVGTSNLYSGTAATSAILDVVKLKDNKTLSVYIASTSYGFAANIEYTYHIIYSS